MSTNTHHFVPCSKCTYSKLDQTWSPGMHLLNSRKWTNFDKNIVEGYSHPNSSCSWTVNNNVTPHMKVWQQQIVDFKELYSNENDGGLVHMKPNATYSKLQNTWKPQRKFST
jgi:hypothetical protein